MFTEVEIKRPKYSKPKENALPNLDERIADVLLLLDAHSGNFKPQTAIRLWLGGKWSSHRVKTMDRLVEMGWVESRRVRHQNWFMLTPSCHKMLLDRKRDCDTLGVYSEVLKATIKQEGLL